MLLKLDKRQTWSERERTLVENILSFYCSSLAVFQRNGKRNKI